ncbi:MAG: hypothetical protein ACRCS8_02045 [Brevinema sp.]
MDNNWRYKIEKDVQTLAESISRLSVSLEKFIEYSKEIQHEKFTKITDIIEDHEIRIRKNTRFVYQALGMIALSVILIDFAFKFKLLR